MKSLFARVCLFLPLLMNSVAYAEVAPTEERILNLPNDEGKWYISVVGNPGNATYERAMGWFNTDPQLKDLRDQVRFCVVHAGTPIFKERYESNIAGLPTIRVQEADGTVVYEVHGSNIPETADEFYISISEKVCAITRPLLPWRRKMEQRKCPSPNPVPPDDLVPPLDLDPPAQPLDGDGPPDIAVNPGPPKYLLVLLAIACVVVGAGAGVVVQWRKTYPKESG